MALVLWGLVRVTVFVLFGDDVDYASVYTCVFCSFVL